LRRLILLALPWLTAAALAVPVVKGISTDAPKDQVVSGHIVIPTDAADIAAGRVLYLKNCASCHGPLGEGNGPADNSDLVALEVSMMLDPRPTNFHKDKLKYGTDDAHVFTTVWLGARHWRKAPPTSGMTGFKGTKVTKSQVLQILAYIKHDMLGRPLQ
jgi:mono/diheme cytochrome c family protein